MAVLRETKKSIQKTMNPMRMMTYIYKISMPSD